MPPVSPELQKLAAEAGVDHSVVQYLQARGILSMGILGALAKSFDEIDAAVIKPFIAGHEIAGVTHQAAPDTEPVVTAQFAELALLTVHYVGALLQDRYALYAQRSRQNGVVI